MAIVSKAYEDSPYEEVNHEVGVYEELNHSLYEKLPSEYLHVAS